MLYLSTECGPELQPRRRSNSRWGDRGSAQRIRRRSENSLHLRDCKHPYRSGRKGPRSPASRSTGSNGNPDELEGLDGRRQPSLGGRSQMNREVHVSSG